MKRTRTKSFLTSTLNLGRCLGMFLLMSALAVGMVSCGGDDDDGGGKSNRRAKIAGKWVIQCIKVTKIKTTTYEPDGPGPDGVELKRTYCFQKWDKGTQLALYEDGTYTDSSGDKGKWDVTNKGDIEMDDHELEYTEEDPENAIVETEDEYYHYYWCWYKVESFVEEEPEEKERQEHCLECEWPTDPGYDIPTPEGNTPPNIEGCYLMKRYVTVYCSDGEYYRGQDIGEEDYIRFSNQNMKNNTLNYENNAFITSTGKLYGSETGPGANIQGSDNSFTVWFKSWGDIAGTNVRLQTFTVISGTKTKDGIRNLYYMTMCSDKQNDKEGKYMAIGTYRIFKDGDGFSPETEWRTRAMAERAMEATNIYPWQRYAVTKGGQKK